MEDKSRWSDSNLPKLSLEKGSARIGTEAVYPALQEQNIGNELKTLGRWLAAGNPFYLISAALALFASTVMFDTGNIWMESGVPVAILAGFTALCAMTVVYIVRHGKVWSDARSLLFIIQLLPMVLSVSLDDKLVDRPLVGSVWLAGTLLFVCGVTLWVCRRLDLRLGKIEWIVYVAQMLVYFIWPFLLSRLVIGFPDDKSPAIRGIALFPLVYALAGMVLYFQVRRGALNRKNGTPWPFMPVVLFAILGVMGMLRTYLLTISFYGGRGKGGYFDLESGFAGWMILPILLVAVILLTEVCLRKKDFCKELALFFVTPLALFLIGGISMFSETSPVQRLFFRTVWGAEPRIYIPVLAAESVYLAYLLLRKRWYAGIALALILFGVVLPAGAQYGGVEVTARHFTLSIGLLITLGLLALALLRRRWWSLLALLLWCVIAAACAPGISGWVTPFAALNAIAVILLAIGWVKRIRPLQHVGLSVASLLLLFSLIAVLEPDRELLGSQVENLVYLAVNYGVVICHVRRWFLWWPFAETVLLGCVGGIHAVIWLSRWQWKGGVLLVLSLLVFGAAFAISLCKGGILPGGIRRAAAGLQETAQRWKRENGRGLEQSGL